MSGKTIKANDDRHRLFVAMRLGLGAAAFPETCGTVGIEENGQILAAVVFTNYETFPDTGNSCCWASIAALPSTNWCTRRFVKAMLSMPFDLLGVCVLRTMCLKSNTQARRFNEKLGLKYAGRARRGWDGKRNAIHYDMLPHEAEKWLGYEPDAWKRRPDMENASHG